MKKITFLTIVILAINLTFNFAQEKIKITKAEDLPKHSYTLENKNAMELIQDKEAILELATMMKKDIETDLAKYDIQDKSELRDLYGRLRTIAILDGDYEKALKYIEKERKHTDKESDKITRAISAEAFLKAAMKENTLDPDKLNESITSLLEEALAIDDFSIIQEDIEGFKGSLEIYSKNLILGIVQGELQQTLDNNTGDVPADLVARVINMYYILNYYLPYKEAFYQAVVAALDKYGTKEEKVDIWKEREVVLENKEEKSPVVIGIWDTGIDMDHFPQNHHWVNKNEKFDGEDSDANGFVDDVYGVAYNYDGIKEPEYLDPHAHELPDIADYQKYIKGIMDLQANISSDEASELKKHLSSLKPEDIDPFLEKLGLYGHYAHGTHVAGIAAEGNALAKVMVARLAFDTKNIPEPPTEETAKQWATMFEETIAYFKEHNVRVVNMSWSVDLNTEFIRPFELNGVGENDEARMELARKLFAIEKESFVKAVVGAPEILFICAAGNDNNDADFAASFPASLNLPNLITVGAVDIEGKKTGFTTEGTSVDVFANGYEVLSYVPGGDRIAFSGTSMASPQVANLAGKILAVNPDLEPVEVIQIIVKTSTISEEDKKVLLIHPKNAVDAVKE